MKERFKEVVMFYDHDEVGNINSTKLCNKYQLKKITTGSELYKDISDYIKEYGKKEAQKLVKNELEKILGNY